MNMIKIIPWVLIVVGALINFLVPVALKKKAEAQEDVMKSIYIAKSLGLIMVIVGCAIIFWLGGMFGV